MSFISIFGVRRAPPGCTSHPTSSYEPVSRRSAKMRSCVEAACGYVCGGHAVYLTLSPIFSPPRDKRGDWYVAVRVADAL